jgi:hypothetical protein
MATGWLYENNKKPFTQNFLYPLATGPLFFEDNPSSSPRSAWFRHVIKVE